MAACLATALLAAPLSGYFDLANIVMLFLLTVVLVAVRLGRGPAVLAAFVSVGLFDFFYVPPRVVHQRMGHVVGGDDRGRRLQLLGELEHREDAFALAVRQLLQARRLDVNRMPVGVDLAGEPGRAAHEVLEPGLGPMPARIAPRSSRPGGSLVRRDRSWTSSSTRSAVRRSASSRSAIRLPLRKKFCAARSACSGSRPCRP